MPTYGKVAVNFLRHDVSGTATDLAVADIAKKDGETFTGTMNAYDLIVANNLTVNGTQTILNTETLQVEDKEIDLGKVSSPSNASASGGGIKLLGGSDGDKTITWLSSNNAWNFSENIEVASGKNFKVDGTTFFVDATNNKVGLGVTSPIRKLHVVADNAPVARFERDTSDGAIIEIRDTSNNTIGSIGSESGDLEISAENSNNLRFAVGTSEKFRVGASGQLGVGGATYGTSGQVLTSGGGSAAPTWSSLPAAGSTVSLIADGAIGNNVSCNVKSNGKVEAITSSPAGSNFVVSGQAVYNNNAWSYDTEHNIIVDFFQDNSDDGLKMRTGVPSGSGTSQTITWSSATTLYTNAQGQSGGYDQYRQPSAYYQKEAKKHLITWRRSDGWIWGFPVSINSNGTFAGKGTPTKLSSNTSTSTRRAGLTRLYNSSTSNTGSVLLMHRSSSSSSNLRFLEVYLSAADHSISKSNDMGWGPNGNWQNPINVWYDEQEDQVLVAAIKGSDGVYTGIIDANQSLYWSDQTAYDANGNNQAATIVKDPISGKVIVFYIDNAGGGTGCDGRYKIGTYNSTKTTITWGSELTWQNNNVDSEVNRTGKEMVTYDSTNNKWYIAWGQQSPDKIMLKPFTINAAGTVLTFETDVELYNDDWQELQPFAHTTNGNVYTGMQRPGSDTSGAGDAEPAVATAFVESTTVTTENFLGWSSGAYSDGDNSEIKVVGNIVTGLSSLTPGRKYYIQLDGSLGLTPMTGKSIEAGTALTSSTLLIKG